MQIYKITNTINGKIYIGQTKNTFHRRYDSKLHWWKSKNINDYLKRSINKYGHENFSVEILHEKVESFDKLDELEIQYIKEFDCLFPNGYNFASGGQKRNMPLFDNATRDKLSLQNRTKNFQRKFYLKNHKTEEILEFINMKRFSEENNLSDGLLNHVIQGKRKVHKFWTLPETKLKHWVLRSPEGEIFDLIEGEYRPFCDARGIHRFAVEQALKKGWKGHKGWDLLSTYEK